MSSRRKGTKEQSPRARRLKNTGTRRQALRQLKAVSTPGKSAIKKSKRNKHKTKGGNHRPEAKPKTRNKNKVKTGSISQSAGQSQEQLMRRNSLQRAGTNHKGTFYDRKTKKPVISSTSVCAPHRIQNDLERGSCLFDSEISEVVESFNNYTTSNSKFEPIDHTALSPHQQLEQIGHQIRKNNSCQIRSNLKNPKALKSSGSQYDKSSHIQTPVELCLENQNWLQTKTFNLSSVLKPSRPGPTPRAWLSSEDILLTMQNFEKLYDDFKFYGPYPRDFISINMELPNSDLVELYRKDGIKRIGVVFNLDRHHQPGSHWTSLFIDMSNGPNNTMSVEYFDSVGECPPDDLEERGVEDDHEIEDFMKQAAEQLKRGLNAKVKKRYNTVAHQKKDSECGVYSLYFIINRLVGRSFKEISEDVKHDDEMFEFRNTFFR